MEPKTAGLVKEPSLRLSPVDLMEMFFRSFFFQTLWNFKRLQNIGWLFTIWPALRRLYPDPKDRQPVVLEHFEYFNTHPTVANLVLGVVAGMEEDCVAGRTKRSSISATKKFMSGPLAALGDTMFWAVARPFLAVAAMIVGWFFFPMQWWVIPALFLLAYNIFHLSVRGLGLWIGYRRRTQVVPFLTKFNLPKTVSRAYALGLLLSAVALLWLYVDFGPGRVVAGFLVGFGILAMRGGVSSSRVFYAVTFVGFVYGYMTIGQ